VDDTNGSSRVAVVTGAARGIGRAIALELATRGYDIVVTDIEPNELSATARLVEQLGRRTLTVEGDVSQSVTVSRIAEQASGLGNAEVLVNNAAIYPSGPWIEISEDEWDHVMSVNVKSAFLCCSAMVDQLAQTHGSIVNVTSNTFFRGWENLLHYVSSKGALVGFTRALARELGKAGIRVNAVAPGAIPTHGESIQRDPEAFARWVIDNQSLKRRGSPADIAKAVGFLASQDSSFITGQTLVVDGGWMMH